jgi:hypothetical protein
MAFIETPEEFMETGGLFAGFGAALQSQLQAGDDACGM